MVRSDLVDAHSGARACVKETELGHGDGLSPFPRILFQSPKTNERISSAVARINSVLLPTRLWGPDWETNPCMPSPGIVHEPYKSSVAIPQGHDAGIYPGHGQPRSTVNTINN